MKLSHFNFDLPVDLLAEYPAENRDEARLMVLNRADQTIEHKLFKDLIDYFEEDDVTDDFRNRCGEVVDGFVDPCLRRA